MQEHESHWGCQSPREFLAKELRKFLHLLPSISNPLFQYSCPQSVTFPHICVQTGMATRLVLYSVHPYEACLALSALDDTVLDASVASQQTPLLFSLSKAACGVVRQWPDCFPGF